MITEMLETAAPLVIPFMIFVVFIYAHIKKVDIFEIFVEGAKDGFMMAIKLIPYLVGIYVAVGIFRESGAIDILVGLFSPILSIIKAPTEVLFLSIVRSLSGPAALGMLLEIFDKYGPDSFIGRLGSTLIGSTDTTFYIIAVYFGSVGIRNPRYSIPVGLFADFASFVASVYIVRKLFL
ncbi:MAG: spore maturation protein [Thermoanaerobacteraceae bacterium]|jgi:spore maturation protein B|uniref:Spore maturation protein n=1 Tax=Biomaibacter acetigenes TaxID=2316383 RepID=A0A3G2R4N4_9FIRM|nr:nucleoside recognition domain-containing protein [Biomaibacter acetigenes]AYO29877.1 spore maturation protein [Biomaibacter acetigenes]MDK2879269.1 spore maturation protein [Thermoanaerobacteraceae bacterium]MDN5302615.1 spore maturation protein [Thermoanaerobacteraceae bacterium]RKL64363.1 spore maturation protein [Thermoanaerobacteraceae bacterium SP2]